MSSVSRYPSSWPCGSLEVETGVPADAGDWAWRYRWELMATDVTDKKRTGNSVRLCYSVYFRTSFDWICPCNWSDNNNYILRADWEHIQSCVRNNTFTLNQMYPQKKLALIRFPIWTFKCLRRAGDICFTRSGIKIFPSRAYGCILSSNGLLFLSLSLTQGQAIRFKIHMALLPTRSIAETIT